MTIQELENAPMTPALAYVLGLIFPLYVEKDETTDVYNQKKYAVGCINHNVDFYTEENLAAHFNSVYNLFQKHNLRVLLKSNKKDPTILHDFSCSPKDGFSCLVETTGYTKNQCEIILRNRVCEIKNANIEIKKYFVAACFDGRGSWDTTLKCFSVDIDRKISEKESRVDQNLLKLICESVLNEGSIQLNRRNWGHKKHDQMRIRKNYVRNLLNNCNLFSLTRIEILTNALTKLGL